MKRSLRLPCNEPNMDPPEPEPVKSCAWCGEDICIGDGYYAIDNDDWVCEGCMESAYHTAEQDDICDPWEDLRVEEAIEKWKGIEP